MMIEQLGRGADLLALAQIDARQADAPRRVEFGHHLDRIEPVERHCRIQHRAAALRADRRRVGPAAREIDAHRCGDPHHLVVQDRRPPRQAAGLEAHRHRRRHFGQAGGQSGLGDLTRQRLADHRHQPQDARAQQRLALRRAVQQAGKLTQRARRLFAGANLAAHLRRRQRIVIQYARGHIQQIHLTPNLGTHGQQTRMVHPGQQLGQAVARPAAGDPARRLGGTLCGEPRQRHGLGQHIVQLPHTPEPRTPKAVTLVAAPHAPGVHPGARQHPLDRHVEKAAGGRAAERRLEIVVEPIRHGRPAARADRQHHQARAGRQANRCGRFGGQAGENVLSGQLQPRACCGMHRLHQRVARRERTLDPRVEHKRPTGFAAAGHARAAAVGETVSLRRARQPREPGQQLAAAADVEKFTIRHDVDLERDPAQRAIKGAHAPPVRRIAPAHRDEPIQVARLVKARRNSHGQLFVKVQRRAVAAGDRIQQPLLPPH